MKRILVIDDDQHVRSFIVALLESTDFEVIQGSDGADGVRLAKEHRPQLIICDINMPNGDGYTVLKELRKDPSALAIPFIFLTAKGAKEDLRHGMNSGADDYLTKPFKRADLLSAIDARLAKQAALS